MTDFAPHSCRDFPPVPFSATDVVGVGSLSGALKELVFRSPGLESLRIKAKIFADDSKLPFDDDAGFVNPCYGSDEPVLPLRYFKEEDWDTGLLLPLSDLVDEPENPEFEFEREENLITEFYDEINLRADALFNFLKRKEVIGWGTTVDGQLLPIAHTIWCHPDFYVHPTTGDIYDGNAFPMIRRWSGVVFSFPGELPYVQSNLAIQGVQAAVLQTDNQLGAVPNPQATTSVISDKSVYQQCLDRLVELMQASPDKPITNSALWEEVHERWPALSKVKFKQAKANAVAVTQAFQWSKSGAPKRIG